MPGVRALTDDELAALRAVVDDFDADDVAELAAIERETVHDVKAVEYFVKRRMVGTSLADLGRARAPLLHQRGRQQPRRTR